MKREHYLETLYDDLGRPAWFWPVVFLILLLAFGLAGWVTGDVQ